MLGLWLNHDMESLEAISQDDEAKRIFLRMAALSQDGRMGSFLTELAHDEDRPCDAGSRLYPAASSTRR